VSRLRDSLAVVKLDRAIIAGLDGDPARQALVAGMRHFAVTTGCGLIAEGIETEAELAALRALGVSLGQGYYLGRPEARPPVDADLPPAGSPVSGLIGNGSSPGERRRKAREWLPLAAGVGHGGALRRSTLPPGSEASRVARQGGSGFLERRPREQRRSPR
jgi:hypothetical protein